MQVRMVSSQFAAAQHYTKEYKTGLTKSTLHWHNCYEMDIILSGTGTMVCNGRAYEVHRGLTSLLSPADFHEYRDCLDLHVLCVQFAETNIAHGLLASNVAYADEQTLTIMLSLCELLGALKAEPSNVQYDCRLIECLIMTFQKCCTEAPKKALRFEGIQKAVVYLNAHFRENPKMHEVAQMLHFSDSYFCRLFKQCVGTSYKDYLKRLRLEFSYQLLKNTQMPITDIVCTCGYETQSHFNREFKKYYHVTPSSLR